METNLETNIKHVPLQEEDEISSTQDSITNNNNDNPAEISQRSPNQQKWKQLICHLIPLSLLMMIYSIVDSSLLVLIPLYTASKLVSSENNAETIAGLIITFQGIGLVITSPFIGYLIAKTSTEFSVIVVTIIRTISLLIIWIYSNSIILWCIISFFYGCAVTGNAIAVNHFTAKYIKAANRGRSAAIINGMRRLGSTIGPLFAGHIDNFNISLLIIIIISSMSIMVVCCLMVPPNIIITDIDNVDIIGNGSFIYFKHSYKQTFGLKKLNINNWIKTAECNNFRANPGKGKGTANNNSTIGSISYVLKTYGKLILSLGIFAFGLRWVRITRKVILTFHGSDLGLSKGDIGNINSISFFPDTLMFPVAGYLMDKYGRKATAIPGLILFIIALSLISFTKNFISLALTGVVFGLADGITSGLLMTTAADLAPIECKSQFISIFRMTANLPVFLTPIVVGSLCSNVSLLSAAILSAGIGLCGLFWITFILDEPKKYGQKQEKLQNQMMINNELNNEIQLNDDKLSMILPNSSNKEIEDNMSVQ